MTPKEALAVAKAANPEAKTAARSARPNGRKPGDKVTVSADDYGRDPIAGEIVFSNAHEIAIRAQRSGGRRSRGAFPARRGSRASGLSKQSRLT